MILGLTGLIGSGKTTIAKFFPEHGFIVIDADRAGHEVLENDEIVKIEIINDFGDSILDEFGNIDRQKLGDIIFSNAAMLEKLNNLLHPVIIGNIKSSIQNYKKNNKNNILIEAPLFIETDAKNLVDKIIVVKSSKENIIKRLSDKYTRKKIENIMKSQMPVEEKLKYADFVIDNNGTFDEAKKQVDKIMEKIFNAEH